jgi:hypothetical protein
MKQEQKQYIVHLQRLGISLDHAIDMSEQATDLSERYDGAEDAILEFATWHTTQEGIEYWSSLLFKYHGVALGPCL